MMHLPLRKYEYARFPTMNLQGQVDDDEAGDSWSRKGIVQIAYTIEITVSRKECHYVCIWYQTRPDGPRCIDKMQLQIPGEN